MRKKGSRSDRICLELRTYSVNGLVGSMKTIHLCDMSAAEGDRTKDHCHDFYELVVVVHGEGSHCVSGVEMPLKRGQVYLIPPRKYHFYSDVRKIVLQNFMFSREVLKLFARILKDVPEVRQTLLAPPAGPIAVLESTAIAELDLLQSRIALESHLQQPEKRLHLLSALLQVWGIVFGTMKNTPAPVLYPNGDIATAASYMRRNYAKDVRLPELAAIAHMSVCSFLQHFTQEFHTTPIKWLTILRLRHAMEYLMRSEWSIADAAEACGFKDPLYFARQFKKYLGCTPSQYRLHGQGCIQIVDGERQFNDESFLLQDDLLGNKAF